MTKYLVEELAGSNFDYKIKQRFRIDADSPQEAMWVAGGGTLPVLELPEPNEDDDDDIEIEGYTFLFHPSELFEVNEGYLWSAADGSTIAYEVRNLDEAIQL